ncbi:hypothetical protein BDV41DRAFT_574656 [Aspergillus transmontanensis]|uniref:Uncharacterized protein n=1 Tax=Aspergillus transmontanensis TaxID=1034304 RepID=A0A5N6W894_9EURO|nr:hypothetical protein BDV41DRAFT_574656 [Aspergillus transmontanensis]
MSRLPPEDNRYPPGPSHRPYPRRDDRDGRMYDDRSRSRSPGAVQFLFPTRQLLTVFSVQKIFRALPREGLPRTEDTITLETARIPDLVTAVGTVMSIDDAHLDRPRPGTGGRHIEIATGRVIARLDTTVGAEVTVGVGVEARDEAVTMDKKAEK